MQLTTTVKKISVALDETDVNIICKVDVSIGRQSCEYSHDNVDDESIPNLVTHIFLNHNSIYEANDACKDSSKSVQLNM